MNSITITVAAQLAIAAHTIPLIRDNTFRAFLPAEKHGRGRSLENEWQLLALLYSPLQSDVRCVLHRLSSGYEVIAKVYGGGYTRDLLSETHHIPVPDSRWGDMLCRNRWVQGTPHWGFTDENELRITESGVDALAAYIREQERVK